MATTTHPITIEVDESTYNAARETAESRGYQSVEEYVSDWLEKSVSLDIPMTDEIANALKEGIADIDAGRVISLEEHNRRHVERRSAWIRDHQG